MSAPTPPEPSIATAWRKKPVVVEAMQFNGLDDFFDIVEWMKASGDTHALAGEVYYSTPEMAIQTLEGRMSARPGDWIIRGVHGEFYPCKPEIFDATYEAVVGAADSDVHVAVRDAARAVVASEATRHDETIPVDVWLATNRQSLDALAVAVAALDANDAQP